MVKKVVKEGGKGGWWCDGDCGGDVMVKKEVKESGEGWW